MYSLFYQTLLSLFVLIHPVCATKAPLVVYIHETIYLSQRDTLMKHCEFPLVLKPFSGADLLSRTLLEKGSGKADIIVGLEGEQAFQPRVKEFAAQLPLEILDQLSLPFPWRDECFLPIGYSYLAFLYDRTAPSPDLKNLQSFLKSVPSKSIVMPDPRTSMVGRSGLSWIRPQDDALLHKKVLTYPRGWSASMALFRAGKTPVMLGYSTSVLYHQQKGHSHIEVALFQNTPHPIQLMTAFILKKTHVHPKAVEFLKILVSQDVQQKVIENYSYPVIAMKVPESFENLRPRAAYLPKEFSGERLKKWMRAGYAP